MTGSTVFRFWVASLSSDDVILLRLDVLERCRCRLCRQLSDLDDVGVMSDVKSQSISLQSRYAKERAVNITLITSSGPFESNLQPLNLISTSFRRPLSVARARICLKGSNQPAQLSASVGCPCVLLRSSRCNHLIRRP